MSKETQNKWKTTTENIRIIRDINLEIDKLLCKIETEAFEKGEEEGRKEKQRIYTVTNGGCIVLADTDMQKYEDSIKEEARLQTLEEVERVFLKHYIGKNFKDLESVYELEPIVKDLQKLKNKMKTK